MAQEWGEPGSKWYYNDPIPLQDHISNHYTMEHLGDTVLGGISCKVLGGSLKEEYMYEEGGVVRYWQDDSFHKIYDFTAVAGDTIEFTPRVKLATGDTVLADILAVVDSVTEIVVSSLTLNRFHVRTIPNPMYPGMAWPSIIYTEYIGSETELIEVITPPTVYTPVTLRCFSNDQIDYVADWWSYQSKPCDYQALTGVLNINMDDFEVSVSPTLVLDEISIKMKGHHESVWLDIFSATGQRIFHRTPLTGDSNNLSVGHLPPGVYFLQVEDTNTSVFKVFKILLL